MRTTVRAAQRLPYRDYMRALIAAEAEAEAPTHRQLKESLKEERIN